MDKLSLVIMIRSHFWKSQVAKETGFSRDEVQPVLFGLWGNLDSNASKRASVIYGVCLSVNILWISPLSFPSFGAIYLAKKKNYYALQLLQWTYLFDVGSCISSRRLSWKNSLDFWSEGYNWTNTVRMIDALLSLFSYLKTQCFFFSFLFFLISSPCLIYFLTTKCFQQ